MICYSDLFDAAACRFGLVIGSVSVVLGETSECYLSSLVQVTYLTISLNTEKFSSGIKM